MSANPNSVRAIIHEHIEIPHDPRLPSEATMRKYRWICEDEQTGQEIMGFSGLSRTRAEKIGDLIKLHGDHDLAAGRMPPQGARKPFKASRRVRP